MAMAMMRMGGGPPQKPVSAETKKRIVQAFAPYKSQLALIALFVFLSAGLGLFSPYWLRKIIDEGLGGTGGMPLVIRYSVLTLLATVASVGFAMAYGYLSTLVGVQILRDLRARLFTHLQGMSLRFFTSTRTGEIQSRLLSDVGGVQGVLSDTVANVLNNATTVVSTLVAMFLFDWRLSLLSVGILPLFALVAAKVGSKAGDIRKKSSEQNADLSATMQETLSVSGMLLTKTSGRQSLVGERFHKENVALTATQIQLSMIFRFFFNLIGLTFSITPALVYWLAGYLKLIALDPHITLGLIVSFTALQSRLFFPLTGLMNVQVEVTSSLALFDRIFEYLDRPQEITDALKTP